LRGRILLAFAAVYLIWGSTYLAIRFAIETLPPFLMAGARFTCAGAILYAVARARGAPRPERIHWRSALLVGGLLLLGGNGLVVWAEQRIPSGTAALIVGVVPIWIATLQALERGGRLPRGARAVGLLVGVGGVALLVGPDAVVPQSRAAALGGAAVVLASLSWAVGSLLSRRVPLPKSGAIATATEMLCGGALLLLAGTLSGEWSSLDLGRASATSWLSLVYLTIFGSIVAFSAYIWLLRVVSPALAATYAYVNPLVAVFLGWALGGEPLTARVLAAAAIIVGAVVLMTNARTSSAS